MNYLSLQTIQNKLNNDIKQVEYFLIACSCSFTLVNIPLFIQWMISKQINRKAQSNRMPKKSVQNSSILSNKQAAYMDHFNSLKKDSNDLSFKASRTTNSSQYYQVIEDYSKRESLIDKIQQTFDNGKIYDMFSANPEFSQSKACLVFPIKISSSIAEVNRFYSTGVPLMSQQQIPSILTIESYSDILASSALISSKFQEVIEIKKQQSIKSDYRSQTVAAKNLIQTKVDLLLAQISSQKKRNKQSKFFQEGMTIKLTEFIDYLIDDDQKYLGLSLTSKALQIQKNIAQYCGKLIDGYLKIPLIEIFFMELRELSIYRLLKAKGLRKKSEKIQMCSDLDKKSAKSSSSKGGKYSEPNNKRQKQIRQQDWIGRLQ